MNTFNMNPKHQQYVAKEHYTPYPWISLNEPSIRSYTIAAEEGHCTKADVLLLIRPTTFKEWPFR